MPCNDGNMGAEYNFHGPFTCLQIEGMLCECLKLVRQQSHSESFFLFTLKQQDPRLIGFWLEHSEKDRDALAKQALSKLTDMEKIALRLDEIEEAINGKKPKPLKLNGPLKRAPKRSKRSKL